jgi:hypothetical protein
MKKESSEERKIKIKRCKLRNRRWKKENERKNKRELKKINVKQRKT